LLPNLAARTCDTKKCPRIKGVALASLVVSLLIPAFTIAQTSEQQIEISFRAGQAALKEGHFVRATEEFKKVLSLDPTLLEAQVNLGLAYQSLLDYDAAARYLTHALRERPNLSGLNVIVGMDYIKLGSPQKAAPYLEHALKLDPSSRDAHDAMALYYLTQENLQGAVAQYREVADLDPDKPGALFKIGHQYLDLAARLAYRGARLYPDSPWGHRFLGDMLLERGRWEDAGHEYQKALAIDPHQPGLHTVLGESYLQCGNCIRCLANRTSKVEKSTTQKRNFARNSSSIRGMSEPCSAWQTFNWQKGRCRKRSPRWKQYGDTLPSI
jgi:tetratricopeptide (TPR) repeat protein